MTLQIDYSIEVCIVTLNQAIHAELNGADRLEVCDRLETGGMTPDFDLVGKICERVKIPVRVMIRATPNGFVTDPGILDEMISSIHQFRSLPIDGFVFGVLKNNKVDREAMNLLLEQSDPLPVTFHKAIELSSNIESDLKWMNGISSIDTILTSGGAENVLDGIEEILKMKSIFKKEMMAAGKIRPDQLLDIHERLELRWYHGQKILAGV